MDVHVSCDPINQRSRSEELTFMLLYFSVMKKVKHEVTSSITFRSLWIISKTRQSENIVINLNNSTTTHETSYIFRSRTRLKKKTRKDIFLEEMEQVVPWNKLIALIEPHYPVSGKRGRPPKELAAMFRIYCLQQWFNLSDPAAEEALYDSESMRRFARVSLLDQSIPDETTILNFRHLLEAHGLQGELFKAINGHLEEKGLLLRQGTVVDATHDSCTFLHQKQG